MNPRLAELIIWFLELGQLYILIYGLVGGLILVGIFLAWAKDQEALTNLAGYVPILFLPMMLNQVLSKISPEDYPGISLIMNYTELIYLIPVFILLAIAIKGFWNYVI